MLIGDWLNRINQAEQSVRENKRSVKELQEQLMATKYQSLKSPHPLIFVSGIEQSSSFASSCLFAFSPGRMDKDVSDFVKFS